MNRGVRGSTQSQRTNMTNPVKNRTTVAILVAFIRLGPYAGIETRLPSFAPKSSGTSRRRAASGSRVFIAQHRHPNRVPPFSVQEAILQKLAFPPHPCLLEQTPRRDISSVKRGD